MGICTSEEQPTPVPIIPDEEKKFKKLLLLGAGWSGKSTIYKQMKVTYGAGFTEEERKALRWTIYQNVTQAMKTLCEENKTGRHHEIKNDPALEADYEALRTYEDTGDNVQISATLAGQINRLWADPAIKATYQHRTDFFFANDEVHYFFNNLDKIVKSDYIPEEEDVLRCRWISSGVKREEFQVRGIDCELLDVGGQRSERKKWVKCFENVHIVIFVVAISEYDQVMYEDEDSNRVLDALDLFDDICNSKWFCGTNVVLYLNKLDLFNDKVTKVPLKSYFPDFQPPDTDLGNDVLRKKALEYLQSEFLKRNHQERKVVCKFTTATEDSIRDVFSKTIGEIIMNGDQL